MNRLIVLSESQSVRHHIIKLFAGQPWQVVIHKQSDFMKLNQSCRQALIIFHLDSFSTHRLEIIDALVTNWQVIVIGPTLTTSQMELIWSYSISEYFTYDTPACVILKKTHRIVQTQLGQSEMSKELGNCRFDAAQGQIATNNEVVHLSKLETSLVDILVAHSGKYISRTTLIESVWPIGVFASDDALDVLIRRTRFKLAHIGITILVKRGFGYRLSSQQESAKLES